MHGCGWGSGAARERSSALWLPASPRVMRSAPMAWPLRARAPVAAGSLPRATRSAPKAGALRAPGRLHVLPAYCAHVVSWGGVGMSKTSCAACCSRGLVQGVLRTNSCRGRGWGSTPRRARTSVPPPPPRSSGAPVLGLGARHRGILWSCQRIDITPQIISLPRLRLSKAKG